MCWGIEVVSQAGYDVPEGLPNLVAELAVVMNMVHVHIAEVGWKGRYQQSEFMQNFL